MTFLIVLMLFQSSNATAQIQDTCKEKIGEMLTNLDVKVAPNPSHTYSYAAEAQTLRGAYDQTSEIIEANNQLGRQISIDSNYQCSYQSEFAQLFCEESFLKATKNLKMKAKFEAKIKRIESMRENQIFDRAARATTAICKRDHYLCVDVKEYPQKFQGYFVEEFKSSNPKAKSTMKVYSLNSKPKFFAVEEGSNLENQFTIELNEICEPENASHGARLFTRSDCLGGDPDKACRVFGPALVAAVPKRSGLVQQK